MEGTYDGDDAAPASRVRQHYKRMFIKSSGAPGSAEGVKATAYETVAGIAEDADAPSSAARAAFSGVISTVFAPHLQCAPPSSARPSPNSAPLAAC